MKAHARGVGFSKITFNRVYLALSGDAPWASTRAETPGGGAGGGAGAAVTDGGAGTSAGFASGAQAASVRSVKSVRRRWGVMRGESVARAARAAIPDVEPRRGVVGSARMLRSFTNLRALTISIQALALAAGATALTGCDSGALVAAPLATDQRGVSSMTTDGSFVYWTTTNGAVRRVSIDGGRVETIVDNLTNPDHVVVDASHVYMTTLSGAVSRTPKGGGAEESLFVDDQDVAGVEIDDGHVYWARRSGQVKRVSKVALDDAPETIAEDPSAIRAIGRAGTSLLWAAGTDEAGALREVAVGGGSVKDLPSGSVVRALATSDNRVAWVGLDTEAIAMNPQSTDLQITAASLDGGDVRVLARGLTSVYALAMDESQVFFSTLGGDVSAVSLDGGEPRTIASGDSGKTRIAIDLTNIYWAREQGSAILSAPKQEQPTFE